MGDENPIRTLGDYSKPIYEGYRNTIELPIRNNMVPFRSDTIRLVQNGCSFYVLRSEDPNQHLKDFFKLVDSLDLDGDNRERTRLRLFQFSLRDQASNWLECLPAGSITTWEDLTTRFLAQFFPLGTTAKLRNDLLMFQQHHGESLFEAWTRFKKLLQKVPHHGIDLWLQNDPRDFAKPVKAIALPQDVPSTSERLLIKLEYQVQRLMEAHLAPTQPSQVNKITTSCEIYSGPHDTQYCIKNLEKPSLNTHPCVPMKRENPKLSTSPVLSARSYPTIDPQCSTHIHSSINTISIHPKQPKESQVNELNERHDDEENLGDTNSISHPQPDPLTSIATEQVQKLNTMLESLGLVPRSPNAKFVCSKEDDGEVMFIEIIQDDEPQSEGPNEGGGATTEGSAVEYFDTFPTSDELTYHRILIIDPRLSQVVLGRPFIETSDMTHDPQERVVRFINRNDEVAYKMPHKIEQYNSLSNLEKEDTKSVYLRNHEDKERGVDYVMNKILGFYKECLELCLEYVTRMEDEKVT
ncbi:MAK10-like protein [Tanacetum coccineum]